MLLFVTHCPNTDNRACRSVLNAKYCHTNKLARPVTKQNSYYVPREGLLVFCLMTLCDPVCQCSVIDHHVDKISVKQHYTHEVTASNKTYSNKCTPPCKVLCTFYLLVYLLMLLVARNQTDL